MYKKYQDIGKLYPLICKNKALNIMKISILLLLLGILSVSATGYSQEARVSITVNNTTINEVFTEIKAQTNYSFWFDVKDISWGMEEQKVKGLSQISCINIRFAHQITGCADMVIPYVTEDGKLCHTLIISPPGCGKTTLLRDLVRQISDGWETFPGNTVGVVDERSEIGGSYQGIPQNDVGIRTDVLDCCSKAEGMVMLLRSMAPQVIAVDEIGNYEDIRAIEMTLNSGCKLLATVHGSSIDEIRKKPLLERLIKEHVFERYIILQKETAGKIGKVREIYDERGTCLYQRQRSVC